MWDVFRICAYIADENNRFSHIFARGCLFIVIGAIYIAVRDPQTIPWSILVAIAFAAIGAGLYFLGERNEAREIEQRRREGKLFTRR